VKLEEMLLIRAVKETEPWLNNGRGTVDRNSLELVCISAESALRIVEHVKDARVQEALVRAIEGRPEHVATFRGFLRNT
jgi:hypothetical protein